MFVDTISFNVSSGNGGPGCSCFRREKFIPNGGPDGGDGGNGGDVIFTASSNTHTLSWYKGKKYLKATKGAPGMGRNKSGKRGENLELIVPPGTQIIDKETKEVLFDLTHENESCVFLLGGKGGLGNTHFKNSRNQAPTYAQPGIKGEEREITLELKLIANVGLVGFPNVGKSTLISCLSNARPEIANYEFTTLTPKLGIVDVDEYSSFTMADIPGIIEGASEGKGLGLEFLRHIERTQILLFMLDVSNYRDLNTQYEKLQNELKNYSQKLFDKPFAIAFNKIDTMENEELEILLDQFVEQNFEKGTLIKAPSGYTRKDDIFESKDNKSSINTPFFILPISGVSHLGLDKLRFALFEQIK